MKLLLFFCMLPNAALSFQQVAPPVRYKTASVADRAEQCATLYDVCNVEELETLADGKRTTTLFCVYHILCAATATLMY